jgi:serine/threonine-protein kinase RsbW
MSEEPLAHCEFDTARLLLRLDITVAADRQAVDRLIDQVMETAAQTGCAKGKEFEIRLALDEALTNAVVHGCRNDPAKIIQCCVACDEQQGMLIVVRDPGAGFDPSSIPSPVIGQNIFATHGRGIYLINQLVDEVRFERGGTEIHMRISRSDGRTPS